MRVLERFFGPRVTAVALKILHPFKYPGLTVMSSIKFHSQLSAMFTCREGQGGKLRSQASKILILSENLIVIAYTLH